MSDRSSSRWRWLLLAVIVVLLVARFATSRYWVSRSVVGGGPPAVLVAETSGHRTIEKWDWKANRRETIGKFDRGPIARGMLCTGDGMFVWFAEGTLHTVDVAPPHEHRQWKTTAPSNDETNQFTLL